MPRESVWSGTAEQSRAQLLSDRGSVPQSDTPSRSAATPRQPTTTPLADNSRKRSSTSNIRRCCPSQVASLAQQQGIKIDAGSARVLEVSNLLFADCGGASGGRS